MSIISTLIVEDEELAADKLAWLLGRLDPTIRIVQRLDSVEATVAFLRACPTEEVSSVELIFLDIHLADGSAFEIFRRCPVEAPIIFTTAYDRYAIEAFKQHSIDYLLKPLDETALAVALHKFRRHYAPSAPLATLPDYTPLAQLGDVGQLEVRKRFMVYNGSRMVSIETERIASFYSLDRAIVLHTLDDQRYTLPYRLERLEQLVPRDTFFRVNRQLIVSIHAIQEAQAYSKSRIKLFLTPAPPVEALVPVERLSVFKKWFGL
jgi:two-component system, LytTR family, response regulator LytT